MAKIAYKKSSECSTTIITSDDFRTVKQQYPYAVFMGQAFDLEYITTKVREHHPRAVFVMSENFNEPLDTHFIEVIDPDIDLKRKFIYNKHIELPWLDKEASEWLLGIMAHYKNKLTK